MTIAQLVGPGLQDLQKQGQRILAAKNAKEAKEKMWIGWMIAAESIEDLGQTYQVTCHLEISVLTV